MNSGELSYVDRAMLALRYAKRTRIVLSALCGEAGYTCTSVSSLCSCASASDSLSFESSSYPFLPSSSSEPLKGFQSEVSRDDLVNYFREWFMSRKKPLFDRIFEILRTGEDAAVDSALSRLDIQLTEGFVIEVLKYDKNDVLSCLKFFDWAGRRSGYHHTRATFNAIFRIISKAKLMNLMMDFLQNYEKQRYVHKVRYHNILIMGYAVAGKPETALQILGKMRYRGMDLDPVAYHVLMNSLVEQGLYDVVETLAKHIEIRGFRNEMTHAVMIKNFCKQNKLERGAEYLQSLVKDGSFLSSGAVGTFVDALCRDNQFERAAKLVEEFRSLGFISMERAYSVWIRNLVKVGELDGALDFMKDKQDVEGYVPDVFRYNMLLYRLLRENRIVEVYDLLVDMKERDVLPDNVTMNAILCFLCKAGMMDIALHLYESRAEFGLSVNFMAYNYLINALLGDAGVDEAYNVLKNSIEQGVLPGDRTLAIVVDALSREGKLDKMSEVVRLTIGQNIVPNKVSYDKFISALCRASRVQEGYLMHLLLNTSNKPPRKDTYVDLIRGLSQSSKGDVAAKLFIEMQDKGYKPTQGLVRKVISAICETSNAEDQFFKFFEMQLDRCRSSFSYNAFIDGAGHAGRPELALQIYLKMKASGIQPSLKTEMLLLRSYIKCQKIAYAVQCFRGLIRKWRRRKVWVTMIVALCKASRPHIASPLVHDMKANGIRPSIECYEELIHSYCAMGEYGRAILLVNDMAQDCRPITSFIGNRFLFHALRNRKVCYTWDFLIEKGRLNPVCATLGHTVGVFCGAIEEHYDEEEMRRLIEQTFRVDIFTNNLLLRRIGMSGVDRACRYLRRLVDEGYKPNKWTYDIMVHNFTKYGRMDEARKWMEEMQSKGFDPSPGTLRLYMVARQFVSKE